MSLDVGAALRRGAERAATPSGLLLLVPFAALSVLNAAATARLALSLADSAFVDGVVTTLREAGRPDLAEAMLATVSTQPLALPVSPAVAGGVIVAVAVSLEATRIVADRTFVAEAATGLHEPTRRLGRATLTGVLASLVVGLLLVLGAALVLPALLVAVVFFFTRQFVAWEDESVVGALRSSVSLALDAPLSVLGLAAGLFVVDLFVGSLVGGVAGLFAPVTTRVVELVAGAAVSVYASAVAADAFRQLRGLGREEAEREEWEELLP
ncbi:hypothetical protein [Halomarina litorea]|uniref:hypothetical protein n=1 Tax=Halomarina litorea TaxID=2961595 RepID=UPI0020C52FA8|nr:hypothetical protein [Halomarina sp. BCD28]